MKKNFLMLVVLLLAVTVAMPALAAVEFKYGGYIRERLISQNNFDGSDDYDDHLNRIDMRFRLYFTFKASENLQLVTKFEGNAVWGDPDSFGRVGADYGGISPQYGDTAFVVKNVYLDFAIPGTPTRALVGVQTVNFLNDWMVSEDYAGAILKTKLAPFVVSAGYLAIQNQNWEANSLFTNYDIDNDWWVEKGAGGYSSEQDNIDAYFLSLDYAQGPLSASLVGFYQDGHDTAATIDPTTTQGGPYYQTDPTTGDGNYKVSRTVTDLYKPLGGKYYNDGMPNFYVKDNQFFDLGIQLTYKLDWMSANLTFQKNFGSFDLVDWEDYEREGSHDYTGWMIDANFNYFCGPYAFNVGGFYTSGKDWKEVGDDESFGDMDAFMYPMSTSKYSSEIIGGGIFDNNYPTHNGDYMWMGYPNPSNLWTVTVGASYQVLEMTKVAASYWYFGSSEDVVSGTRDNGDYKWDNSIGHEIDLNITQGIVDGLTLDLVGAYLFAGDAFSKYNNDDDAYELGARLQWAF